MLNYSQKLKNHLETNCPFKEGAKLFAAAMAAEEKSWIALEVITKRSKAKDLIQKYDLKKNTLYEWVSKTKAGLPLHAGAGGRPGSISDEIFKEYVIEEMTQRKTGYLKRVDEVNSLILDASKKTFQHNTLLPLEYFKEISPKTINRYYQKYYLGVGNAESTTTARANAVADIRGCLSLCAAYKAYLDGCDPRLIFNGDACQFTIGGSTSKNIKVAYIKEERIRGQPLKTLPQTDNNTIGIISVKRYVIVSSYGDQAPPIYVISDHRMPKNGLL